MGLQPIMDGVEVKLRAGGFMIPVKIEEMPNERLGLEFAFNRTLLGEVKSMEGARWHGHNGPENPNPRKIWSIKKTPRNFFQLQYLMYAGTEYDPYGMYDLKLNTSIFPTERYNHSKQATLKLFAHTPEMAAHLYQRRQCILAGEMGTAKTIACILALEQVKKEWESKYGKSTEGGPKLPRIIYVAPRAALKAVQREFVIWDCQMRWQMDFMTYEGLTKLVKDAESPEALDGLVLILDESSKVKNPQSQRSQAAKIVADRFRTCYPTDACIWLMSGSPAPKSPIDWWSQAEIARPGFLKEGDVHKFKNRLGIVVQASGLDGVTYPQLKSWRDDPKKCDICGESKEKHLVEIMEHAWVESKNEVDLLYRRLKGLVYIKFKKDCLDLPDKNYRIVDLKPSPNMVKVARLLSKTAKTTIEALTKLRELSDGFQYTEVKDGTESCPLCHGSGRAMVPESGEAINPNPYGINLPSDGPKLVDSECPNCQGKGEVTKYKRTHKEVACPKDEALVDLLDEYEDVGRVVIYAGFTASIDRCVKTCLRQKWCVIRVDQGKDVIYDENGKIIPMSDYLSMFQDHQSVYPRVAFVAHPGSAGMGLTLTASPVIIYYSNDFNAESRIQSEDRIHRPGMDVNRGATIIDLIHLPSDEKVLENLRKKRVLQSMTLGEVQKFIEADDNAPVER